MNPLIENPPLPIVPRRITVTPAAKKRRDRVPVPGVMSLLSECLTEEKSLQLLSYAHMKYTDASEDTKRKWARIVDIHIAKIKEAT